MTIDGLYPNALFQHMVANRRRKGVTHLLWSFALAYSGDHLCYI